MLRFLRSATRRRNRQDGGVASGRDVRVTAGGWLYHGDWSARCAFGRGGMRRDKREGDGATPVGRFPLGTAYFRSDRLAPPPTALALAAIDPGLGWCDDPHDKAYNRPVRLPHPARHERMWRDDRLYDLLVVIGYNRNPVVPDAGSAIFLHVAKPNYASTEGCVALELADLQALLRRCRPGDCIQIESQ
ncbi:MAG: L,D-transpeptidase family protein [Defluviicoccus sp.]|nr:MAG: L,D-transpeptidase family protein [Defluviicoccus sp.]